MHAFIQPWPGGLARDQSSRSWLASSLPAFFEALRLLLSRCHARRAAVAQTSPACAYCRRRPRRPHPRRLQESHQFGQESRAALLLSLACGTHCSVRGCNLRHAPLIGGGPRSSSGNLAKFTANRAGHRFGRRDAAIVRNWGRSGSARIALETTLMTLKRHPGSSFRG